MARFRRRATAFRMAARRRGVFIPVCPRADKLATRYLPPCDIALDPEMLRPGCCTSAHRSLSLLNPSRHAWHAARIKCPPSKFGCRRSAAVAKIYRRHTDRKNEHMLSRSGQKRRGSSGLKRNTTWKCSSAARRRRASVFPAAPNRGSQIGVQIWLPVRRGQGSPRLTQYVSERISGHRQWMIVFIELDCAPCEPSRLNRL
jgi:hypothetical protein